MTKRLRVGVIGVSAERGWARESHVPAIRAVDGLELVAVANRNQARADAAGAAFGVPKAYGDAADLIADPDVDIVTVAASVPAHRGLILAAIASGKHVVTEWPVGISTAQTEQLAVVANASGLRAAAGLQALLNPAAVRAVELVESGAIGRILSATVYSSTAGFGPAVPDDALYLERPETGMNLTTIQLAHTVDFAIRIAGQLTSLAALTTTQYPDLLVGVPPKPYHRTIADHVLLHGRLAGGGALAVQVAGGRPADDTPFRMDLIGDDGTLSLQGGSPRGFQAGLLSLHLNGDRIQLIDSATAELPPSVVNVARLYAALRDDITNGTTTAPNFDHAVRLSHLIDGILDSAAGGQTLTPSAEWPHRN